MIARAKGDADRILRDAEAKADTAILQADSNADSFRYLLAQHYDSPEQTRLTLFRQMVKKVADQINVVAIAPGQGKNLNINLLETGTGIPPFNHNEKRPGTMDHHKNAGNGEEDKKHKPDSGVGDLISGLPSPHDLRNRDRTPGALMPHKSDAETRHTPLQIQEESGGKHDPNHGLTGTTDRKDQANVENTSVGKSHSNSSDKIVNDGPTN